MNFATKMVSGDMIHLQSLMEIGSGIQVISRITPQQFERLFLVLRMGGIYDITRLR
jgi:hypothetical protein